jgi:hypothetical protein
LVPLGGLVYSEKLVRLASGRVFRIDGYILAPSTFSDVVVFGKTLPPSGVTGSSAVSIYKLLIDDEIVHATPVR